MLLWAVCAKQIQLFLSWIGDALLHRRHFSKQAAPKRRFNIESNILKIELPQRKTAGK